MVYQKLLTQNVFKLQWFRKNSIQFKIKFYFLPKYEESTKNITDAAVVDKVLTFIQLFVSRDNGFVKL